MSLPNEPKTPEQSANIGAVTINPAVPTDNFIFEPADDWWIGPDTPEFDPDLDPEYINMLEANAPKINMYSPQPLANMNTPYPENSTGQYNPRLQQSPIDRTTQSGALRYLQNQIQDTTPDLGPEKPFIPDPIYFSRNADKFDRFYEHGEFRNLGFNPYIDNDQYYNANSTIYDDMGRMLGQLGSLTGSGFTSVYRSIGDIFDSDPYLLEGKDLETADEFETAMDIGMSSREGFGAFANNALLNSGYTMGILSSIALEELALAGLTYVTGGGAAPVAGARTAFNIARLGKAAKNLGNTMANSFAIGRLAKATRNMARNLNNVDKARDFYSLSRSGAKGVGKILFPETMAAVSKLKTAKTGAQNLTFMAKYNKTFGGFYRDLRSFNLAVAEGKLEAGFAYKSQIANGILAEQSKPGSDGTISAEQMASIAENADKAAYGTMLRNVPLLFLSNQLVLGNAMGGFNKSIGRLMNDKITGVGRRLIQKAKTVTKDGKIVSGTVLQDAGTGITGYLRRLKAAGVKGSAKMAAGASLRYFSANVAEGLQEVAQEAIAKGTSEYYTALQLDPTIGGSDLHSYSVRSAIGSQFSGQGFETFMSGFVTGGIVQAPQMLYFQAVPYMYKNLTDREGAVKAKQARQDYIDKIVKTHQESWDNIAENPLEFFDPTNFNISVQKQVSNEMKQAAYVGDAMSFYDSKDFGKFHNLHTMFEQGTIDLFRNQYRDFLKLSDEELATAFNSVDKKDIKSGKFRKGLEDQLVQIDKYEDAYNRNKDQNPNPYDERQFKEGTPEYQDEALNRLAHDHVRYLQMFTEDSFNRALERSDSIYNELAADPILSKLAADDITVLLDQESIKNEIKLLQQESDVLEQNEPNNEGIKKLRSKRDALANFLSILQDKANQNKNGSFNKTKINKLRSALQKYVDVLAKNNNGFVDKKRIDDVLKKIVDYGELRGRAGDYDKAIRILADPGMIERIRERQYRYNKEIFINNKETLVKRVKNYLNKKEANDLLNKLFAKGIYPEVQFTELFLQTGDIAFFEKGIVLGKFLNEDGAITPRSDTDSFNYIKEVIAQYKESMEITVDETEETEGTATTDDAKATEYTDQESQEVVEALKDVVEDFGAPPVDVFGPNTSINPVGRSLVNQLFRKRKKEAAEGGPAAPKSARSAQFKKDITPQVEGYKSLKRIWYYKSDLQKNYKSKKDLVDAYNNDEGFLEFLFSKKTDPQVREILDLSKLTFDDFYKAAGIKNPDIQKVKADKDVLYVSPSGNYITRKLNIEQDGKSQVFYQVRTNLDKQVPENILGKYDPINKGIRPTAEQAKDLADVLDAETKSSDILQWKINGEDVLEGLDLSYGVTVADVSTGEEFILTTSPRSLTKYKNLSVIPVDKKNLKRNEGRAEATKTVKPEDFAQQYKVVDVINFEELPSNVNKLPQQEAIRAYSHRQNNEDRMVAQRRVDLILQELRPEERKFLELIVTKGFEPGKYKGQYGFDMKNGRPTNPYIDVVREKYSIGIRINPEATVGNEEGKEDIKIVDRIKRTLREKFGVDYTTESDGVFAYLPNNNVILKDSQGKKINPTQITKDVAVNTFMASSGKLNLNIIRNNFAAQANLVDFIDRNIGEDQGQMIINMPTLQDYGFETIVPPGFPDYDTAPKSLRDLDYNTVDGNTFVFDNRVITRVDENGKTEIVRADVVLTDIEDSREADERIKQLEDDLSRQNLLDKAKGPNAYVAVVKSPSGYYTLADLQASEQTPAALKEIFEKIVKRAIETTENNLTDPKKKTRSDLKDDSYNLKFNEEIRNELFISTQPGYNIDLKVDPRGRIEAKILDKTKKGKQQVVYITKPKGTVTAPNILNLDDVASINETQDYDRVLDIFLGKLNEETKKREGGLNNSKEAKELGIKINRSSMREGFPVDVSVSPEEGKVNIIDKTTTKLQDVVRNGVRIHLRNDSTSYQARKLEESPVLKKDSTEQIIEEAEAANFSVNTDAIEASGQGDDQFVDVDPDSDPSAVDNQQGGSSVSVDALTGLIDNTLEERNRLENEITKRERELYNLNKEGKIKDYRKALDNDAKLKKLRDQLGGLEVNKILLNPELTNQDITSIEDFTKWSENALPSFIGIEDINVLGNNLKAGGVRVGAFVLNLHGIAGNLDIKGTIYTGASNPYKYHEAFHGVFRMLLTDQEISKYLGIARREVRAKLRAEGKNFREELERFKNSADTYKDMSEERLLQEYYEEYLADEFEKFKNNPKNTNTSSEVKSLFTRILEWIKSVLGAYSRNELTTLFQNIDAGKYRTATPVINRFTSLEEKGISIEANALVPYDKIEVQDKVGFKYLDVDNAASLVASMASVYIDRARKNPYSKNFKNKEEILQSVIKDFQDLYDINSESYKDKSFEQIQVLRQYDTALRKFQDEVIEGVSTYLDIADIAIDERYFIYEEEEDEKGLRGQDDWAKENSEVGGWGSLTQKMKMYIMTTSYTQEDIFGNSELLTGEKLIVPVDFGKVYNGFMKALKNTTDDATILKKMYIFGKTNPQTGAVVNRMFNDIGITEENIDNDDLFANVKDPAFQIEVIKAFKNFKVGYIFVHRDKNGNVESYSAAKRDDAGAQLDIWKQKYDYLYSNFLSIDKSKAKEAAKAVGKLERLLKGKASKAGYLSNLKLDKEGNDYFTEISNEIDNSIGIKISPTYIKFSVIQRLPKVALEGLPEEKILSDAFRDLKPIDGEKITYLKSAVNATKDKTSKYIFKRDKDADRKGELSMTGFLTELSANNAPFDESVGASVITNPNGDKVYTHQKPTLHLRELNNLNDSRRIEELKQEDYGYLANNLLLNSPAFNKMSELGQVGAIRISGAKEGNLEITEDEIDDSRNEGKTYGDFTPKEFMLNLLNAYTYNFNSNTSRIDSTVETADGTEVALAPILIRVIEASNTGDLAPLPILKAVEFKKGKIQLTDELINAFKEQIKAEFERIKRETNEETKTKRNVVDYLDGKKNAYKFTKTSPLLKPVQRTNMLQRNLSIRNSDKTVSRIKDGNQSILVYKKEDVAKYIKFSAKGDRSSVILDAYGKKKNTYEGFIESLGTVKVGAGNRDEIIGLLGDAIIESKATESHPVEFELGSKTYAVESKDMKFWILGRGRNQERIVYKIITPEDAAEVIDRTDEQIEEDKGTINIYYGSPESETNTKILSNLAKREFTYQDRSYGSVEHAYQSNKSGVFDQATYDKYVKVGGFGKKIRGKAVVKGFDNLQLMKDLVVESFIQNPNSTAATKLFEYSNFTHTTNTVIDKAFLDGINAAKAALGFKEAQNEIEAERFGDLRIANYEKTILDNIEIARQSNSIPELSFEDAIGSSMQDFDGFLRNNLEDLYLNYYDLLTSVATKQLTGLANFFSYGIQSKAGDTNTVAIARANKLFNLISRDSESLNLDYNLRQVFFNSYINSSELNRILSGDTAMTLQGLVNEAKRAKKRNAAFIDIKTSVAAPELGVMHPTDKINFFGFEEPQQNPTYTMDYEKGEEEENKNKVDNADAQVYMTTKAARHVDFGIGNLSPELATLYDFVEGKPNQRGGKISISNNRLLSKDDDSYGKTSQMLNSKKLVYGDRRVFVKMSAFPLTKEYTSTRESGYTQPKPTKVRLHNLRLKMEASELGNNTIAMAGPVSALKELKENIQGLDFLDNTEDVTEDQAMVLSAENMGLQTVTPSNKLIIKDSTQVKTLVTSEHSDDTIVMLKGKQEKLGELRKAYNKAISDRVTLGYTSRRNSIFNFDIEYANKLLEKSKKTGVIDKDLAVYLKYASDSLKASNATSNILELFSTDENGEQKYNLNSPQTIKRFEELFLSFFSKGVLNEKVSGISAVLASDLGVRVYRRVFSVDENGKPDRQEVIREDVWERMAPDARPTIAMNIDDIGEPGDDNNLNGLAGLVEESKGEGVVIIDRLRQDLKVYDENGVYQLEKYTEAIMPAHFESVANLIKDEDTDIPDVISKMFATRIPSQDNHSTVNIKLVDFMPTYYGSTVVLARELIEISGADFDIDKLYIQIKDFFVNDNDEFVEYGKVKNDDEGYDHYIRATNQGVKGKKPGLVEGVLRYKTSGALTKLTDGQISVASDAGMSENAIKALSALGLPVTKKQYKEYKKEMGHEPYSEAMSNDALDYKYTLMGNTGVTDKLDGDVPLSYQPAVTTPLEKLLDDLVADSPYFRELNQERDIDGDSPYGQTIQFTSNKAGAKSIGAVVLPNLYLNLLQEYKVKLGKVENLGQLDSVYLKFNNKVYDNFGAEKDSDGKYRNQFIISALITAMTDNAKLVLSHKLGLNKDALGVVANMTALGVPIKTSILLINHPTIRELYFRAINKVDPMDPGIKKLTEERIGLLENAFEELENVTVTDKYLLDSINDYNPNNANKTIDDLKKEDELTFELASRELSMLKQFLIGLEIRDYTKNMSAVMNLVNGLGRNFSQMSDRAEQMSKLGLFLTPEQYNEYSDERLKKKLPVIDARPLFKNTWQGTYVDIFEEVYERLLPNVLLSSTPGFMKLWNNVVNNMSISKEEDVEIVRTDLVSYLTIKAYQKKLLETNSQHAASLSNELLYPQLDGEKITEVVEKLRNVDPGNFFLENFVILTNATSVGNRQGIYKAEANTFRTLNDKQKVKLQTSFAKLYGDFTTRPDAMKILHYMMIKDGFKYAYASLGDAVTPFIYETFLQQINNVEKAMYDAPDLFFVNTFGINYTDLTDEFIKNYLVSSRNRRKLKLVKDIPVIPFVESSITVDKLKLFNKREVASSKKTLFIFSDNESQQGTDANRGLREFDNAISITYKRNLGTKPEDYYQDVNEFSLMFDKQLEAVTNKINQGYDKVKLPLFLIPQYDLKPLKENSPDVYEYIKDKVSEVFEGYNIETGKKTVEKVTKTKKGKKGAKKYKPSKTTGAYIEGTIGNKKLIVNTYPAASIKKDDATGDKVSFKLRRPLSKDKKGQAFREKNLKSMGFRVNTITARGLSFLEVELPKIVKVSSGTVKKEYSYYVLTKFQSSTDNQEGKLLTGNYAEYVQTEILGSDAVSPVAFIGGERPATTTVQQFVKNINAETVDDGGGVQEPDLTDVPFDMSGDPNQKAAIAIKEGRGRANVTDGKLDNVVPIEGVDINPSDAISLDVLKNIVPEEQGDKLGEQLGLFDDVSTLSEELLNFWNENIDNNKNNLSKLRKQNLQTLELYTLARENFTGTDEQFIEEIKCYL